MRKIALFTLCAMMIVISATGCVVVSFNGFDSVVGEGTPEEYTIHVGEYTRVYAEIFCNIEYYSAPSEEITLKIQPNLAEYVITEVSDGVLFIHSTRRINWSGMNAPVLTISAPELSSVSLLGAGEFTAHDKITGQSLAITLAGAGSGTAEVDVDFLSVDVSGAGYLELSGWADEAEMDLAGAGSIDALALRTKDADIRLSGAGSVSVACSDNLIVNASGVGSVEYKGSPTLDIRRDGVVEVRQVG